MSPNTSTLIKIDVMMMMRNVLNAMFCPPKTMQVILNTFHKNSVINSS